MYRLPLTPFLLPIMRYKRNRGETRLVPRPSFTSLRRVWTVFIVCNKYIYCLDLLLHGELLSKSLVTTSTSAVCRFVEIMAPVFSREAWRCVWYMIQVGTIT